MKFEDFKPNTWYGEGKHHNLIDYVIKYCLSNDGDSIHTITLYLDDSYGDNPTIIKNTVITKAYMEDSKIRILDRDREIKQEEMHDLFSAIIRKLFEIRKKILIKDRDTWDI